MSSSIRSLPLWRGDIEIESLDGGITNLNYKVTDGRGVFAVRTGEDDPRLGISRRNEVACARLAAAAGIAPAVVHAEAGVMVCAFVAGAPLTPETAREPERLVRLAAVIRRIHELGASVTGHLRYFCPFQVARSYVELAARDGLALPDGVAAEALLEQVAGLRARVPAHVPTFCHNDLMPGNFLDDGATVSVIDWEYAGIGNPLFDLAGICSNCELDADARAVLLDTYFAGANVEGEPFRVMLAMAALRESLWAVVQGSQSAIDFDYGGYRDDNYRKYRAAVERV